MTHAEDRGIVARLEAALVWTEHLCLQTTKDDLWLTCLDDDPRLTHDVIRDALAEIRRL